ncbi:MAG: hypothetical protein LW650_14025 [Planctomycetaceae bacterium]|nr:hypothetical protein [Phycisphaerales bacterium]MCE2654517.1 hypothetical protein [Planctomycetaceae bacterium]
MDRATPEWLRRFADAEAECPSVSAGARQRASGEQPRGVALAGLIGLWRRSRGMSSAAFAAMAGIEVAELERLERGDEVGGGVLAQVAGVLGVSAEKLIWLCGQGTSSEAALGGVPEGLGARGSIPEPLNPRQAAALNEIIRNLAG